MSGQSGVELRIGEVVLPLWKVWLYLAALIAIFASPVIIDYSAQEPDDWLRLLQVRDWVAGQGWFDTRQYRMDAPIGAEVHWTRLVDIPIAAALVVFQTFLPQRYAETAAMTVVPLGQIFVLAWMMRGLMRSLRADGAATLAAIALFPLFPLLLGNFVPMRIDHHGWQALAALYGVWMLVRGGYRSAMGAGAVAAAWLFISVEGMPLVAALAGLYALKYWLDGKREVEGFLLGLALAGPALLLALRPLNEFAALNCDLPSWPHLLAFAASTAALAATRFFPGQGGKIGRLIGLLPVPLVAVPAMVLPLGICAISPMATLDPLLRENWFAYLTESAPIYRQGPSTIMMLLITPAIIIGGLRLAHQLFPDADQRQDWALLAALALVAVLLSFAVMRVAITAQLLALPFAGLILTTYLPRARAIAETRKRIAATLACFFIATPVFATGLLRPFDSETGYTLVRHPQLNEDGPCDIDELTQLPKAKFFATLDRGPQILGRTEHEVVMGGYHRNQKKMLEVFAAFGGPIENARAIIKANKADYVMACTGSPDIAAYANMGKGNLADAIFAQQVPDWLEPLPGFADEELRIYRVK